MVTEELAKQRPQGWVPRRTTVDLPRQVTYETLDAVATQDAYANLLLPTLLYRRRLQGRDAAFATELTYGCLRNQGFLDAVITSCLQAGKTVAQLDLTVRILLRMGAFQLLFMRVPDHAAVSETVNQTRALLAQGPAKLVNAVLHRIARQDINAWTLQLAPSLDTPTPSLADLSCRYSSPSWQTRALREALRACQQSSELPALLRTNVEAPPLTVCSRPGVFSTDQLADQVGDVMRGKPERCLYSPWGVRAKVNPGRLKAVQDGRAAMQDEGSQLVAGLLAYAHLQGEARQAKSQAWLDLCAGPGGKAGLLAALAASQGHHLVANELQPQRARLVSQNIAAIAKKYPAATTIWCSDGRSVGEEYPDTFQRILVDAPCSGLGAIRRRPESRWRRTPAQLPQLTSLQFELLVSGLKALQPGGVLAYATCSPLVEETRDIIKRCLHTFKQVELLDAQPVWQRFVCQPLPGVTGPYLNLWPHVHNTDAMFVALLTKTAPGLKAC